MNNGDEPAFPVVSPLGESYSGLTRRDWFAGMAMQGILAHYGHQGSSEKLAEYAFEHADAMLKAQEAGEK